MKALQLLVKTNNNFAPAIARLTRGLVMFPHGAQKAKVLNIIYWPSASP